MMEGKILKLLNENLKLKVDYVENDGKLRVSLTYKDTEVCSDSTEITDKN